MKSREAKHEVSKAQILQKEAALQSTKIRLSYTRLNASWIDNSAGYHVAERFQNVGAMLSPNTPIVSIYDLATITAIVEIVERDYYRMKTGQVVQITTGAIPNKAFFGIVARISPFLSSSTRQGRVEIEISNQDFALKPGMFVIAKVKYMSKAAVTAVPITALARRENTEGVFWVDTQRSVACFLPVEKGIIQSDLVEVSSPTISGFVVTLGQHLLEDGTSIDLPGEKENNRETQSERKRGSREGGKKSERGKGKE
ncbi:efflux RND transporter periplasmic adaptor subunit [bacterium]|nr:efflux RND transporter periplasmic adaptor subunit [bacterium]